MEFNYLWTTFCVTTAVDWPVKELINETVYCSGGNVCLIFGITGIILFLFWRKSKWKKLLFVNEKSLEKANLANEALINELNHRVKNNMQIAISLLKGQASYVAQPEAVKAINDGCNRLYVMSLAFHSMYEEDLLSTVNLKDYLGRLVVYLMDEFSEKDGIVVRSDFDACLMNISEAVPLGLILNEAVCNAYKFAFPGSDCGCISISLKVENNAVVLRVSDDGVGLKGPAHTPEQSFGLSLIKGLGRQLSGIVNIENSKGVTVSLEIAQPGQTFIQNQNANTA
ncbi:sensor histidine kinase [Mucilaginibacter psychrotolerans]|uniref:histidine kinase n=1 Tax=Mucilaginibacter psychrotolerans TaxID=1524096 RepID=A0A4Y8SGN7_9SPHI|nr:sensor histidine kinase [Mucilaginibacter psychrotolerans]TFF37795.1 sensor histidine kinase [Mucilaginibacter psychrotolerans]